MDKLRKFMVTRIGVMKRFCKIFRDAYLFSGFKANTYLFGSSMTPGKQRLFWPSEEYKATPTQVAWSRQSG
jgi:hypothetical protein